MTFKVDGINGLTFADNSTQNVTALNAANISAGTLGKARLPTGSVLQVVSTNISSSFSASSTSFTHVTTHSLSITTTVANSRIVLFCNTPLQLSSSTGGILGATTFRSSLDSYSANIGETIFVNATDAGSGWKQFTTLQSVHSPSQSAGTAITYRVYARSTSLFYMPDPWGYGSFSTNFMAMEIAA
jgi:hypothetical protein